jgi:hypothetical protein
MTLKVVRIFAFFSHVMTTGLSDLNKILTTSKPQWISVLMYFS